MADNTTMNTLIASAGRKRGDGDLNHAMLSTPHRQKANELRGAYKKAVDGIRADDNLSQKGKAQLIARAHRNVNAEMRRLSQADWDAQVAHHDKLEAKLFGASASTPESAMSFRDASTRANALKTPDEARAALGSAHLSGDTTMARAIALRAWSAEWQDVVDDFAVNSHPTVGDEIAELSAVRLSLNNLTDQFGAGMAFGGLSQPEELHGLSAPQRSEYADANPQPSLKGLDEMNTALTVGVTTGEFPSSLQREFSDYAQEVRTELREVEGA